MKSPPLALFDLYGTLIVTLDHHSAWEAWHQRLADYIEERGGTETASIARGRFGEFWRKGSGKRPDGVTIFEDKLLGFFGELAVDLDPREAGVLAADLCDTWQIHLSVDPEIEALFSNLKTRTGLVTNFDHPPHIRKILVDYDLNRFFEEVVISGEEGVKKPDPEILRIACRRLRCEPRNAIYVGDSIVDYEAAVAADIVPVIIRRPGQSEIENTRDTSANYSETDRFLAAKSEAGEMIIIKSLSEVPLIIEEIAGRET